MSKEEEKPSPQKSKDTSRSSEGPSAPGPDVVEERFLKLADAMNQQMKFIEGLAERTMKIEQSLAGLGEALKAAANPGKPGSFDLGGMLQSLILKEMAGGGEADKLLKTFAENYLKTISPEGQRAYFNDMLGIMERSLRLAKLAGGPLEPKEVTKTLTGKETEVGH